MKRLKINKSGGITLVSLVVTIVVLLILAGISIAMLTGDNGILTKAREAKEETQIVAYKEALEIIGLGLETERIDESEFLDRYVKEIKADEMFKDAKKLKK